MGNSPMNGLKKLNLELKEMDSNLDSQQLLALLILKELLINA